MAVREIINRVLIERFRISRVPCNPATTIYQGDLLAWDEPNKRAVPCVSTSGAEFMGMSETTNPIETAGSTRFLTDTQSPRLNVVQKGLVEVIIGEGVTIYPYDNVTIGSDAQTVLKTGATAANRVGVVDPGYGAAGKVVTNGTVIKIWLTAQKHDIG